VISDIWQRNWSGIIPLFAFPDEIRRVIYTTNAIESINRQIRKIINNKGVFPDDKSILKIVFLALKNAAKKWTIVSLRYVRIIYEVVMKSLYYFVREIVTFIIMIVDVAKVRATAGQ
jgi:putative transposase